MLLCPSFYTNFGLETVSLIIDTQGVTPPATATASNSSVSQAQLAEGTLTPAELHTSTPAAALPSPTSMVIVTATITESSSIAGAPQPTATPQPMLITTIASAQLCSFAFLVLDAESEEPIRRATIAVFVGIRQETGTTDSTGYYLAKLPCSNGQEVEARVRVSADDYNAYNRSVFLSNETTEILLEHKATPTPTITLTPTTTEMPTLTSTPGPCTATVKSTTGSTTVSLREAAAGKVLNYSIPVSETVLILDPSDDMPAYKISYNDNGREILGWLSADNLQFADLCPK